MTGLEITALARSIAAGSTTLAQARREAAGLTWHEQRALVIALASARWEHSHTETRSLMRGRR